MIRNFRTCLSPPCFSLLLHWCHTYINNSTSFLLPIALLPPSRWNQFSIRSPLFPQRLSPLVTIANFTLFPDLPTELRLKIWSICCFIPRLIPIAPGGFNDDQTPRPCRPLTRLAPAPVILSVCIESRDVGLEYYKRMTFHGQVMEPGVWVNTTLEIDTLHFVARDASFQNCFDGEEYNRGETDGDHAYNPPTVILKHSIRRQTSNFISDILGASARFPQAEKIVMVGYNAGFNRTSLVMQNRWDVHKTRLEENLERWRLLDHKNESEIGLLSEIAVEERRVPELFVLSWMEWVIYRAEHGWD